jgi:hypothetical protein
VAIVLVAWEFQDFCVSVLAEGLSCLHVASDECQEGEECVCANRTSRAFVCASVRASVSAGGCEGVEERNGRNN